MADRRWDDDDSLLADLAGAIADLDGQERTASALGRGAFAWRTVDDDLLLASLSYDSRREPTAALRSSESSEGPEGSEPEPRTLVFSSSPLSVELEVLDNRMVGQLLPPAAGTVVIETTGGGPISVEVDDLGFFMVGSVPAGPVRIRCETTEAKLVTDWIRL